jgi:predicted membrane channel-forming protein YqfA (hemolysin III family)
MANNTSPHILSTSANLLGFCLFVIASFHVTNRSQNSIIDEFTSLIALCLVVSCLFSFISIKTKSQKTEQLLETIADYLFIISLIGILLIVLLIALNIIK